MFVVFKVEREILKFIYILYKFNFPSILNRPLEET